MMQLVRLAIFLIALPLILARAGAAFSQDLAPFALAASATLHPAWQESGLPADKKVPRGRLRPVMQDGETVLELATDQSYGVLTHAWPAAKATQLEWRWKLARGLDKADIAQKSGDDAALKVCVFFDQPLADIPLLQRTALRLARAATGQDLPSATLCYLWDSRYPAGTRGANPYSARVRYLVLDGPATATGEWQTRRRRLADDFALLFGSESARMPAVLAVAVGADSDNTGGQSLAYLGSLHALP